MNRSNLIELASELGQLPWAANVARRAELEHALRATGVVVDRDTPLVVLLRLAGSADVVDDLDAVAAGVAGEAATGAEQRGRVLPVAAAVEAAPTDQVDVVDGDRDVRVGVG